MAAAGANVVDVSHVREGLDLHVRETAVELVLEKLGMRREAHLRENEWVKGEWQSELVYALLAREWRERD